MVVALDEFLKFLQSYTTSNARRKRQISSNSGSNSLSSSCVNAADISQGMQKSFDIGQTKVDLVNTTNNKIVIFKTKLVTYQGSTAYYEFLYKNSLNVQARLYKIFSPQKTVNAKRKIVMKIFNKLATSVCGAAPGPCGKL
jgi:hypothetical protein